MTEPRYVTVNVNLGAELEDVELKRWLRLTAASTNLSMSRFVKHLLLLAMRRDQQRRQAAGQ